MSERSRVSVLRKLTSAAYRWVMTRISIKPAFRGTLIAMTAILIMLLSVLGLQANRHVERQSAAIDASYANWP